MIHDLPPLQQWYIEVSQHLQEIEHGADMIQRHVDQMVYQPPFDTKAEASISDAIKALGVAHDRIERSFIRVCNARRTFREKPHGKPGTER